MTIDEFKAKLTQQEQWRYTGNFGHYGVQIIQEGKNWYYTVEMYHNSMFQGATRSQMFNTFDDAVETLYHTIEADPVKKLPHHPNKGIYKGLEL